MAISDRTRSDFLKLAKDRAIELADNPAQALASIASDITKHPDTNTRSMKELMSFGHVLYIAGNLGTKDAMIEWINGIN